MEKILVCIVSIFFIIGAIDYIENNKFKLGQSFENGLKSIGEYALFIIGMLSLSPFLLQKISYLLATFSTKLLLDPSIFPASILAMDMGGYNICRELSNSSNMGIFSGIIISSTLGTILCYTIPLAIGLVNKKYFDCLFKGILCSIASMPISMLISGIILRISLVKIIYNLLPIIFIALIISYGIIFKTNKIVCIFDYYKKVLQFIAIIGVIVQGVKAISGIELLNNIMPIETVFFILGKMALFASGTYVMIKCIKKYLSRYLNFLGNKYNLDKKTTFIFIDSLISSSRVFKNYENLNYTSKILCTAFCISVASMFGGQLGYVATVAPKYISMYIINKVLCGVIAIIFASILIKYESKEQ